MNRITEELQLLKKVNPQSLGIATVSSAWVSIQDIVHILAELHIGTMVASTTLDFKLEQAKDSGGTGVKDLLVMPQITAAVGAGKSYALEVISENLDTNNAFNHVRMTVTGAGASSASLIMGAIRGRVTGYQPVPTTEYQVVKRYAPA